MLASNEAAVRLCNPYVLARPRTTSTDAPRNPSKLAPSQQKDQKNQTNPEKRKKILLDPLPVHVFLRLTTAVSCIGFEFYSAVVRPYFEGLREKEEEAGGSGWDARKQKSEFLQRVSITIAKGNSRVLDCMRHDWQSSTAPDLVTSTVHNPRTLAATSDPDTHDPTAATPAGGP